MSVSDSEADENPLFRGEMSSIGTNGTNFAVSQVESCEGDTLFLVTEVNYVTHILIVCPLTLF